MLLVSCSISEVDAHCRRRAARSSCPDGRSTRARGCDRGARATRSPKSAAGRGLPELRHGPSVLRSGGTRLCNARLFTYASPSSGSRMWCGSARMTGRPGRRRPLSSRLFVARLSLAEEPRRCLFADRIELPVGEAGPREEQHPLSDGDQQTSEPLGVRLVCEVSLGDRFSHDLGEGGLHRTGVIRVHGSGGSRAQTPGRRSCRANG